MQIHDITKSKIVKKSKRIGRGGKRGGYSGKGIKGQRSRAGKKLRPHLRDVIKKIPKRRGYRNQAFRIKPQAVNLRLLDEKIQDGATVSPAFLVESGILKKNKGKIPKVKILGTGDIKKKITVSNCKISKVAEEKIIKAGGKIMNNE